MTETTNSLSFPNMFDVARNRVAVKTGGESIVNRTRLLMLTEPTELYNNPTFGVGLKRFLWQYNNSNTRAMIQERIKGQLEEHEPCVESEKTTFSDGLAVSGTTAELDKVTDMNTLKMTVGLQTIYQYQLDVSLDLESVQSNMFGRS